MKPEVTLRESEGLLHPELKDAPLLPGEVPMDVIHAQVYQRFYDDNLLTRQIPELENLTITDLLIGRRILAALGNALQARLMVDFSLPAKELFLFAAPLISFNSLRRCIRRCAIFLRRRLQPCSRHSFSVAKPWICAISGSDRWLRSEKVI